MHYARFWWRHTPISWVQKELSRSRDWHHVGSKWDADSVFRQSKKQVNNNKLWAGEFILDLWEQHVWQNNLTMRCCWELWKANNVVSILQTKCFSDRLLLPQLADVSTGRQEKNFRNFPRLRHDLNFCQRPLPPLICTTRCNAMTAVMGRPCRRACHHGRLYVHSPTQQEKDNSEISR